MTDQLDAFPQKRPAKRSLQAIFGSHWAMTEDAMRQMIAIANRHGAEPKAVEAALGRPLENSFETTMYGSVAVIPIAGPIFRKANMMTEVSGATSLDLVSNDFAEALSNDKVTAIVLDVDSPGGEVNGTSEMADLIFENRGEKPIVAVVSGLGASAAYWIASAADQVVASDTSLIGSIGVRFTLEDDTEQLEAQGIRTVSIVSSQSPDKDIDPFTKEGREKRQALADQMAGIMVAKISRNRGVSEKTVLADFGKGDVMLADSAKKAGMIDGIATLDQVIAQLNATEPRRATLRPAARATPQLLTLLPAAASWSGIDSLRLPHATADMDWRFTITGSDEPVARPTTAPTAEPTKENTMSEKDTTGAQVDTGAQQAKAAEERVAALYALKEEWSEYVTAEMVTGWISNGVSAEAAHGVVLKKVKEAQKAAETAGETVNATVSVGPDRAGQKPWNTFGEKLLAVATAYRSGMRSIHPRLQFEAAAQGLNTAVPQEGGFLVTQEERNDLLDRAFESGALLSRVRRIPIGAGFNGLKRRLIDETSRADGSRAGGVQGYWVAEAESITKSKPKFREAEWRLQKVAAVSYLTEEQLQDATSTEAVVREEVPEELEFKAEDAIYNGDGAGKPLGFMKSPALSTVDIESGQGQNQLFAENFTNMYARMPPRSKRNAVWLVNSFAVPVMMTQGITFGTGGQSLFMPAGFNGQPFNTILGRPVVEVEYAAAFNTTGDIAFVDLSRYHMIEKGGIRETQSIHVEFLTDQIAYKFTWRVDGQTVDHSPITPKNANAGEEFSPFVVLGTRS